jgi:hypothetical protein
MVDDFVPFVVSAFGIIATALRVWSVGFTALIACDLIGNVFVFLGCGMLLQDTEGNVESACKSFCRSSDTLVTIQVFFAVCCFHEFGFSRLWGSFFNIRR